MQRNREKQRVGKTRDLFKKIENIKGKFHARMGMIQDRNCKDLTEKKKEIKKRWQEYTELYKKGGHSPRARYFGV